ncbi:hypothetical protein GW17_00028641, partial [Ensete ventricosum]
EGDAGAAGDVDHRAAAVDGLEAVHQQLLIEVDGHVAGKGDPQGALLDDAVPERAQGRAHRVPVRRVCHHVDRPALPAHGVPPEPDAAVRQALPVLPPVRARAPPAVIDGVARQALLVLDARRQESAPAGRFHLPETTSDPP